MEGFLKLKQLILIGGDVVLLYASLVLMLIVRYQEFPSVEVWQRHVGPFTAVFIVWLVVGYIAELYNVRSLKNSFEFNRTWGIVVAVNIMIAMVFFYFIPMESGLAPKTNLLLLGGIFGILGFFWRRTYNSLLRRGEPQNKILIIDRSPVAHELVKHIKQNPQLGYELKAWLKKGMEDEAFAHLSDLIVRERINLIVVPAHIKKNSKAAKKIYQNVMLGIEVMDLATLYGLVFQKAPLSELEEIWFLENIAKKHKIYEPIKRVLEIGLALALGIILIIPALIIAAFIKISSKGPALIRQIRIGRNEQPFIINKFRTMIANAPDGSAEGTTGPVWSGKNDVRQTPVGRILRFTRLDEIPQLWNIISGEMSFVGPRPERPEFVAQLKKSVPYYDLRHLARPGLTGWAQLNYPYGASVEDAYQKLQYDIYYLKNYSFWMDASIIVKTARMLFVNVPR